MPLSCKAAKRYSRMIFECSASVKKLEGTLPHNYCLRWLRVSRFQEIGLPIPLEQSLMTLMLKVVDGSLVEGGDDLAEEGPPSTAADGMPAGKGSSQPGGPQTGTGLPPGRDDGPARLRLQTSPLVWEASRGCEVGTGVGEKAFLLFGVVAANCIFRKTANLRK